MSEKPAELIEIFYSYSHKDEDLRGELENHLSILKRQGVITGWHDRKIGAGREWEGEIDKHLNTAHVILLLISSDFLASDYCYDKEMKRAMERHDAGEARVIPVILRPCDWKGAPFDKLSALPTDAKPVTSWSNPDEAFLDVAKGIRAAVEELLGATVKRERKEPYKKRRRIDAAAPSYAEVDQRIDLLVQVRFPDSPLLGIKDWPTKQKPSSIEQASEPVALEFPVDPRTGKLGSGRLKIRVVAPDFAIEGAAQQFVEVPPDQYSQRIAFLLTAKKAGICRINVEVYSADHIYLGTIPVETTIGGMVATPTAIVANLFLIVMVGREHVVTVTGSGAAASHGGVAAGEGGVAVGGDVVYGDKVGGDKVARDKIVVTGQGAQVTVNIQDENVRDKESAHLDGLLARYGHWRDHYTPLAGIAEVRAAVKDGPRLDLPMPFIPPEFEKLVEHGYGERVEMRRVRVDDLREPVAEHRRIILLGEPGSGKTTTLWRLAYDYANTARADGQAPLPLLVPLGGYTDDGPFDAYLARYLGPLAPYLETYRASRRLILLLDGLNEMPQAGYAKRVGRIRKVLDRQPEDTVVVTCRALDYVVKLEGLQKVEVLPLDEERIRTFLHNYLGETAGERLFWAMADGDEVRELWDTWQRAGGTWVEFWTAEKMPKNVYWKATRSQRKLWERLRKEPPPLLALGRNPYLLLMTAQVYTGAGGELPANRAQLFAAFVDTLLGREKKRSPEQWIEAELQKDGLAALAYAMQAERGRGTTVEREWAVARLCLAVPGCDTERLLYLASSATLLDTDEATVRFYHQLLQEYFAAHEMGRRVLAGETLNRYWPPERWWEPSGWEETAILLAGIEQDASTLLEELVTVNPVVAARCLVDGGAQASEKVRRGITETLIARMTDEEQPLVARVQAGDALARLGDPRPGVGLRPDGLPDVVWCEVPAGPFIMGTQEQDIPALWEEYGGRVWYEQETPQQQVNLPAYSIGKYLVTNTQYAAFVQDGGYTEKWRHCWTEAGREWKRDRTGPETSGGVFDLPNHPVVRVSWYEAVAFCRWLTERLRETGGIGSDQEVMLPTEAQWEKAARSEDGRIFPWGDEFDTAKCNVYETGIRTTSAVGIFPAGASPYGVLDMSGNVWEWCRTKWRDSYREPADESLEGDASRMVRGGAFYLNRGYVRCAARSGYFPYYFNGYSGLRVVVAPGPSGL